MEETLVRVGLFVHIASAIGLFAGLAIELLSGHLVTRAEDTSQVRVLASGAALGGRLAALALVGLLLSGPDLANRMGFFAGAGVQGWVAVAIVVIVAIGAAGSMVHRRAFRALAEAAGTAPASPLDDRVRQLLAQPTAWISMHAAIGAGLATVWLMSNKPSGVVDAIVPAAIGILLGAAAGSVVAHRTAARLG